MRFKYLLISILTCLSLAAYAQPGYQGRKLVALYDLRFAPTINNLNYKSKSGLTPGALSFAHTGALEYVVSRKVSLGLRYSFSRSTVQMNFIDKESDFNIYKDLEDDPFKSYVHGIGFYAKKFWSGNENLAPRGSYVSWHADAYYTNVKDSYLNSQVASYWGNFSIGVSFGKQVIVFDRIMIDYGIESNLCLPGIANNAIIRRSKNSDDGNIDSPSDLKNIVNGRTFDMYLIMFKLGLGFLAF